MARKLLHCEVEAMERGVFVFCRRFKKETFILQEEKTNKVITTKWLRLFFFFFFSSCPDDIVVSFFWSLSATRQFSCLHNSSFSLSLVGEIQFVFSGDPV